MYLVLRDFKIFQVLIAAVDFVVSVCYVVCLLLFMAVEIFQSYSRLEILFHQVHLCDFRCYNLIFIAQDINSIIIIIIMMCSTH